MLFYTKMKQKHSSVTYFTSLLSIVLQHWVNLNSFLIDSFTGPPSVCLSNPASSKIPKIYFLSWMVESHVTSVEYFLWTPQQKRKESNKMLSGYIFYLYSLWYITFHLRFSPFILITLSHVSLSEQWPFQELLNKLTMFAFSLCLTSLYQQGQNIAKAFLKSIHI